MAYKVTFLPDNTSITVNPGTTIKDAANEAGLEIEGPCAGKGTCGKCLVKITGWESNQWT